VKAAPTVDEQIEAGRLELHHALEELREFTAEHRRFAEKAHRDVDAAADRIMVGAAQAVSRWVRELGEIQVPADEARVPDEVLDKVARAELASRVREIAHAAIDQQAARFSDLDIETFTARKLRLGKQAGDARMELVRLEKERVLATAKRYG
jgi:hypothetical protein